jgi:hypothetical protein
MANTALQISISNGKDGFAVSDFTFGTNAPGAGDIELRIAATDANGNTITRKNIAIALRAFARVLESGGTFTTDLAF